MEEVAREVLPAGYTFAWSGLAFEEKQSAGTSTAAFAFGLVIVFLVLAAQYESWTLPGAVMTAVPFGILGALILNWLRGLENDVYFQIGLLVLIGLGAKNALLRVTFAVDLRKQGRSLMDATIEAGEMRLRPIIMTSLAFVLGVLPLAIATGVGANSRHSIGTGIIGGMIGETTLAMLYVPLFFYLFESLTERLRDRKKGHAAAAEGGEHPLPAPEGGRLTCAAPTAALVALPARRAACWGPTTTVPAVDVPPTYRYEVAEARDTANTAWWQQFQDPVLDELIADALAHNLSVQIAAANVEQAAAVLTQAKAPLYPQAGYGAERREAAGDARRGRRRSRRPWRTPRPRTRCSPAPAGSSISGAGSAACSEAARAQLLATEEARRGVVLSLVASVASTATSSSGPSTSSS